MVTGSYNLTSYKEGCKWFQGVTRGEKGLQPWVTRGYKGLRRGVTRGYNR